MRDLVLVKFNSRLVQKRDDKRRDPIEKLIDNVLEDEDNEFITRIVPTSKSEEVQAQETKVVQEQGLTSEAQANKRIVPPRKKRKWRSFLSLIHRIREDLVESISSSPEEDNQDGGIDMGQSDSDKSNSTLTDSN
jgi:hypothetical protein